ncbi:MAG: cyclic nucleotide-binding protein [Rhodospirillaceae bacterium]|nr:MAG: cyclic nucleotide-binding protein [Rhodospirillaceae bacterium]
MSIRKVKIANGMYWVEIPDTELRILCGSPEDSVKHLIRQGFIHEVEENGVTFESGPTAILLSDVSTQDGSFANVSEFPVLQMLYRQGMIIPGHPNNTGVHPLLIGSESQVRTQMDYIFRGNYGLISEEELFEAGVGIERARELMRLKLKFAFGEIKSPRDFLDACIVEGEKIEIRDNVYIHRIRSNVFEISHNGESVEVDLNLGPGESYEPPYHLGYHALNREYFAVIHSGDGDGWDCNRPSMASILMYQGLIYLIDAGPNIGNTLMSLGINISEVAGVFLTHAHDDHFAGITTLMRADRPLKFYSTLPVRASAMKKLSALMGVHESEFNNFMNFHTLIEGQWNDIVGLEVMPIFSPHPVENTCLIFRSIAEGGYKTYAHMADIVSLSVLKNMITDDDNAPGISQAMYDDVKASYQRTADIKKIDVGGGLIHGEATDFAQDPSEKIILAHRATPLTPSERKIGAGAPFGIMDVLIEGQQDYIYKKAARLLKMYFPDIAPYTLQSLLNGPIVKYNPESFLCKEGTVCDRAIILLSGQVERLGSDTATHAQMPSGAIIGELSAIEGTPLRETFRAISFVTTLHIPAAPFKKFAQSQSLTADIQARVPLRDFLQKTCVFNDNMTRSVLLKLIEASKTVHLNDGHNIDWEGEQCLYLIQEGQVDLVLNGQVKEELSRFNFFGETFVLFGVHPVYHAVARGDVVLLKINAAQVAKVPVARWKLLENYQRRVNKMVINSLGSYHTLEWLDEFLIGIPDMDDQHKKLFQLANGVLKCLNTNAGRPAITQAMDTLLESSKQHFALEEELLNEEIYPDLEAHSGFHTKLISEIEEIASRLNKGKTISCQEFHNFFLSWIVFHILNEDRKYAKFIEESSDFLI